MSSEIICGVNAVLEALRAGKRRVVEVYVAGGKKQATIGLVADEAERRRVPVKKCSRQEIGHLSRIEKNQGVAARVSAFQYTPLKDLIRRARGEDLGGYLVLLDDVIDPQNVGSLIRTAHLSGASGVIVPKDRAAQVGPAVTRASAGATEYLPIAQVTNVAQTLEKLKEEEFWIVGADGASPTPLFAYEFTDHLHVIVLGGEGAGIRRLVREKCDTLLSIPMSGEVGSYNVSVAGAIFMSEIIRQRWAKKSCKSHTF